MFTLKTISMHYGTSFSLAHNNRDFIPHNVDPKRIGWNYNCIAAGHLAPLDADQPRNVRDFWLHYKELSKIYWEDRAIHKTLAYQHFLDNLEYMRRYHIAKNELTNNAVGCLIYLLLLPVFLPCEIYLQTKYDIAKDDLDALMQEQKLRDLSYKATQKSLRTALTEHDLENGTRYLQLMDRVVTDMAQQADDYIHMTPIADVRCPQEHHYATLEEIYSRFYEPSFQAFQAKQRPCRRYHGTCLEQLREQKARQSKLKQQTPNVKSRCTAEAIELVIGIGDMDNTGYAAAYSDAKKSEELLKDYCDYLVSQPNVCYITTKELNDPNWQPPFKHGLIILNLTVHTDEATPGIHLTCIPYSRDCKRGPAVQASMGRTMAGMGYPSTWKDVWDENGNRIPKRNKSGEIIHNKDGSIRYKQEPDGQGIIDWIEDQKQWIQKEMLRRYDWNREYKGSHPRGNLSTPDYMAARAKERKEAYEQLLADSMDQYDKRIYELSVQLSHTISPLLSGTNQEIINQYLYLCSDEEYQAIADRAVACLNEFASKEYQSTLDSLTQKLIDAEQKRLSQNPYLDDNREKSNDPEIS